MEAENFFHQLIICLLFQELSVMYSLLVTCLCFLTDIKTKIKPVETAIMTFHSNLWHGIAERNKRAQISCNIWK